MTEKTLRILEYSKIIDKLASYAGSPMAKELCGQLQPLTSMTEIRRMQNETTDALKRIYRQGSVSFSGTKDVKGSLLRLKVGASIGIVELMHIAQTLETALRVKSYGRRDPQDEERDCLDPLFKLIEPLSPLTHEIRRCILDEETIADDASPGLRSVRRQIKTTNEKIHSQLSAMVSSQGMGSKLQDNIITMRGGRYCLPVKAEYRSQVQGMIHDQSSTGATLFIEPMAIVKLNNDLSQLAAKEKEEIEHVLEELSQRCADSRGFIEQDISILTSLDFIFARAQLSRSYNGTEPIFNENGYINLKKARHPLLDKKKVVPIDLWLGHRPIGSVMNYSSGSRNQAANASSSNGNKGRVSDAMFTLSGGTVRDFGHSKSSSGENNRNSGYFSGLSGCNSQNSDFSSGSNGDNGRNSSSRSKNKARKGYEAPTPSITDQEFRMLIVTGPNTGGKTVSLKTVGLLTLMGQSGLHIPAFEHSELSIFNNVFADIGDEQSIEQNLSTFSAHMTNIVQILKDADDRSLVLFDELCAGTDPTEGASLAISILKDLLARGTTVMSTTHYSELKVFALDTADVSNASCEFDVETLSPTYRLLIGLPGKSNAFAISGKLGLPSYIIKDAQKNIDSQQQNFEDLITDLEQSRATIAKEQDEISRYRDEVENLKKKLENKQINIDKQKQRILDEANEKAKNILQDAKDYADHTIRTMNKLSKGGGVDMKAMENVRTKAREKLERTGGKKTAAAQLTNTKFGPESFKPGQSVKVISLNLKGTIISAPNSKGELNVQMGILKSWIHYTDLLPASDEEEKKLNASLANKMKEENDAFGSAANVNRADNRGDYANGSAGYGANGAYGSGSSRSGSGKKGKNSFNRNNRDSITGSGAIRMEKSANATTSINLIGETTDIAIADLDKFLDDAYLAHIPTVTIIHGRGTGALRKAVHEKLRKTKYVTNYRLGTFGEGENGVTIVDLA